MSFPALAVAFCFALGILADKLLAPTAAHSIPLFAILSAALIVVGVLLVTLRRTRLA
jgi:hypothetical protein